MKKNKKTFALLLALLLTFALLAGCGAKSAADSVNSASTSYAKAAAPMSEPMEASYSGGYSDYDYAAYEEYGEYENAYGGSYDDKDAMLTGQKPAAENYDKIIYSGSANVETIRFDETIEQVNVLISDYNGFLESSYVTGRDYNSTYYGRPACRSASFTIRVPRENFQSFSGALESLGNVTYSSVQAQNITSSYFDTQSRLNTYRTEEERLLDMLSKADTVEDMLNIEDRLASVRYSIESLTTTLTNWDSKVNYSTLSLQVSEVRELTPETPVTYTFGERLAQAFTDSCQWLKQAIKDVVIFLIAAIPVLVIPAVIVVIVLLIIRAKKRKKKAKKAANDGEVDR